MDGNRLLPHVYLVLFIASAGISHAQESGMAEGWVARYDGPAGADDEACAIAVDDAGSVYVTGASVGDGSGTDFATVKYDSSGAEQWVARYNGPGNAYDCPVGIVVDGSGNVYVAGTSEGSGTCPDYAMIKYNSEGDEQWVARYNGPGNGIDHCVGIAVTPAGNICMTGYSEGSGTPLDYATVSYNTDGDLLWTARYNGPDNGQDMASSLGVDGAGNVYVTGTSDSESGRDFATVKYSPTGTQMWTARYVSEFCGDASATDIAVDASGSSFVTGDELTSYGPYVAYEYVTVAYDPSGGQQWIAGYVGGLFANVEDIALDGAGTVFVTGISDGEPYSYSDIAMISYSQSGTEQWTERYDGPGDGPDWPEDLISDGVGRVCVTGICGRESTGQDYATIGYDSSGLTCWQFFYNGPGNGDDVSCSCASDGSGNIYVTGASMGSGTGNDFATIRYEPTTGIGGVSGDDLTLSLAVFPNPSTGAVRMSMNLPEPSDCSVRVYDLGGRLVENLFDGFLPAGSRSFSWAASDCPAGVYLVRSVTGSEESDSRVVLLR